MTISKSQIWGKLQRTLINSSRPLPPQKTASEQGFAFQAAANRTMLNDSNFHLTPCVVMTKPPKFTQWFRRNHVLPPSIHVVIQSFLLR